MFSKTRKTALTCKWSVDEVLTGGTLIFLFWVNNVRYMFIRPAMSLWLALLYWHWSANIASLWFFYNRCHSNQIFSRYVGDSTNWRFFFPQIVSVNLFTNILQWTNNGAIFCNNYYNGIISKLLLGKTNDLM